MYEWFTIKNINQIDTPALVIYSERVEHNIRLLTSMIDDVSRLRPHVKTHKAKEAVLLQLKAGIRKFKCATIAEAEMLGIAAAPDVLLAYQPLGPKMLRLIELIKAYPTTHYSCLIDDPAVAAQNAATAQKAGITLDVFIDVNVGMNRTGISPDRAVECYRYCATLKGIRPVGLHAYDGHIHDQDLATRQSTCDAAFLLVERVQQQLIAYGLPAPIIVAGGSPTFPIHAQRNNVECSPGTFIYWDEGYRTGLPEQHFLPAALVVMRIISHPAPDTWCLDLGHKSVAAEKELGRRVALLNLPGARVTGQSEEHLVIETTENSLTIGDIIYGLPYHICPTCALYEKAWIVEKGEIMGDWRISARDRRIHF